MKNIDLVIILIIFQSCSFNNGSKNWNEQNKKETTKQKNLSEIMKKKDNITFMSFDDYKVYIDDYTKKSKYPDLTQ